MSFNTKKAKKEAEKVARRFAKQSSKTFDQVVDYVTPRAQQAAEKVAEKVNPALEDAREQLAPVVSELADRVQPVVHDAYETVSDKVHDLARQVEDHPEIKKARKQGKKICKKGKKTLSDVRSKVDSIDYEKLNLPVKPKKKSLAPRIFAVLGLAALVGVIVVVVKTVLGSKNDGWSPQEPMRSARDDEAWPDDPFEDQHHVAARQADEDVDEQSDTSAQDGSYRGDEPPEGYVIKGNERAMKYHVPEAAGYDRTNADVWFNSEDAAQKAGFTRAQR